MRLGIDARMYSSSFTGIGRYVYELIRNLATIDQTNQYLVFLNPLEHQTFQPPAANFQPCLVNANHYSWQEQTSFLRALNHAKLDLMHFTHFNAPILYRRPFVVTIHDLTLSYFPGKKMTSLLHRTAYHISITNAVKRAAKIISVSEHTKSDLQKLFKISASRIEVIYEAVASEFQKITDSKKLNAVRSRYHLDKPFLLYTGVWRDHKNVANLLKAFAILKRNHAFSGYLAITGKENPYYPEVRSITKELGLENDVKFTGAVPEADLIALYNLAACFAMPSLYEGFGLPILEAFACGTPVVCSNLSSLPEIAGLDNALFFNPHDPADIAAKINSILTNSQLRETLIQRGQKRIRAFSWPQMAQSTLKIYTEVLQSKNK